MYCLLKSQLDGKPFLVTSVDNESDVERIEGYVRDMWLSAELFLEMPSNIPTVWSYEDIKRHQK
jgi:hypothetical protein